MKIWQAIFNILAMVLIIYWLEISIIQISEMQDFYDASALKIKTEYATEAAVFRYSANKAHWKDTYVAMMCNQYDIGMTEQNKNIILDNIAAAVYVSDNTVEYLAKSKGQDSFIVKMEGASYKIGTGEEIVMNLFDNRVIYVDPNTLEKYEAADLSQLNTILQPLGIWVDEVEIAAKKNVIIAHVVNTALLRSYTSLSESTDRVAYIPVNTIDKLGVNSIKGKTLLIIQKDFDKWNGDIITTAGYVEHKRKWVFGFIENGIKYYCQEEEIPDGVENAPGNKLFKDIYEAAKEGYIPATHYLR